MKVTIVKERMRDRVAMPRVKTLWEKTSLQANALKLTLPKTRVTRNVRIGPDRLIKKLCGIILQAVASVWGSDVIAI